MLAIVQKMLEYRKSLGPAIPRRSTAEDFTYGTLEYFALILLEPRVTKVRQPLQAFEASRLLIFVRNIARTIDD